MIPNLDLPWDQDPICMEIMARFPDGASHDVIAAAYERSRNAIWQTEQGAMRKLRAHERLRDLIPDERRPGWWDEMEDEP